MKNQTLKSEVIPSKKFGYERPTIEVLSIELEYSVASGSTAVQQGSIKEEWDGNSSEEREIIW